MTSLFFDTHEDRVALARRQYFEEGKLPSGVISDAVLQSWGSCLRSKRALSEKVEFQPVSVSRSHLALQKNALLCEAWRHELRPLEATIGSTGCDAILTDASGVLIGVAGGDAKQGGVLKAAHRVGVNLSEDLVGTTAPGLVIRTGKLSVVRGGEHYFDRVGHMHCAAAPIRDIHGRLIAVLDISSEGSPFRFDVTSVLGYFASAIENRLVVAQADQHLVVRLQIAEALLDTPLCGLVGVDMDGNVAWSNAVAANLLGISSPLAPGLELSVEQLFDRTVSMLLSMRGQTELLCFPNGLSVFVRCELRARDGGQAMVHMPDSQRLTERSRLLAPEVPQELAASVNAEVQPIEGLTVEQGLTTLRDADTDLIVRTVAECKGNVSAAARKLKVSRGLIYRHMKNQHQQMNHPASH
jgi:transcriptional regulator of acetoin/glycerol metabolism